MDKKAKTTLVSLAFTLFSIFVVGMGWLATTPSLAVSVLLSYVAGLSMIVLPWHPAFGFCDCSSCSWQQPD